MEDYRVELDVYHGPLDLLLYLIRRDEIDIHNIPIAHVTERYMHHCRTLQSLDINLAGEFLVMAATLMEIKSAMMARTYAGQEAAEEAAPPDALGSETDPRFELVQQLLAYKRFKDAAYALENQREQFSARFPRQSPAIKPAAGQADEPPALDMEDVSVWDLLETFTRLMDQVGGPARIDLHDDDTPIELHAADIVDRLEREGPMSLQAMFVGRSRGEMIGLFLAMLELLRQHRIGAKQERLGGEIFIHIRPESEREALNDAEKPTKIHYDPEKPELFDWPDEQTHARYAKRIERRRRGEKIEEDEEFAQDVAAIESETQLPVSAPTPPNTTE